MKNEPSEERRCVLCGELIKIPERVEPYTYPSDGRLVHVSCVRIMLHDILSRLMRTCTAGYLLLDADECD